MNDIKHDIFYYLKIILEKQSIPSEEQLKIDGYSGMMFMINRYISMIPEYIDMMAQINMMNLGPVEHLDLLYHSLPRQKSFIKYMKKNEKEKSNDLVDKLSKYHELSKNEISNMINLIDKEEINKIGSYFGGTSKKI
jgi:hypothetical protein